MKVILLERVEKLGSMGDVAKVKPGYARNYLLPFKKAVRATASNIADFEARKEALAKEDAVRQDAARILATKVEKTIVSLIRQAGEDGRLFGSVRAVDIATALTATTSETITRQMIILNAPIKEIGIFNVNVALHPEVRTLIHVNVARSDDEAATAKKEFLITGSTTGKKKKSKQEAEEEFVEEAAEEAPEA